MDAKKKLNGGGKPTIDGFSADSAQQPRSARTRQQLIVSARKIFARDGFEATRIQDIATAAGKTRGAFYAHFEDKEDVFFAIFEDDIRRDKKRLASELSRNPSDEGWVDAMASHMFAILKDKRRVLLHLEFKMYVLRHPARQSRLVDLHTAMCLGSGEALHQFIPPSTKLTHRKTRTEVAQFASVIDGFALNMLYDPGAMDDDLLFNHMKTAVRIILHAQ